MSKVDFRDGSLVGKFGGIVGARTIAGPRVRGYVKHRDAHSAAQLETRAGVLALRYFSAQLKKVPYFVDFYKGLPGTSLLAQLMALNAGNVRSCSNDPASVRFSVGKRAPVVSLAASFVVTSGVAKLSYVGASWFTAAMREALALVVWNRVTGDYVAYAKGDAGANTFSFATFNDWPDELRVVVIGTDPAGGLFQEIQADEPKPEDPYAEAAESWVSQVQALGAEQNYMAWLSHADAVAWLYGVLVANAGTWSGDWATDLLALAGWLGHVDYNYYDSEQSSAFVAAFHLDNGGYTWGGGILARAGGYCYSTSPPPAGTYSVTAWADSESPRCAVPSGGDTEPWAAYFWACKADGTLACAYGPTL